MKRRLLDLFKGFLMGFDCTIPGFSIGTLAVLLNVYERIIADLNDIIKHPWRVIKDDIFLALGFVIGFILDVITITYLLSNFPLQTVCFFVGMVFATIPRTFKLSFGEGVKIRDVIIAIVGVVVLVIISLLNAGETKTVSFNPMFLVMVFIMGVIGSGSMIIPGISGSLLIMAFGYYEPIIGSLKEVFKMVATFHFENFWLYMVTLIVFIVGVIIGVIGVAKILQLLLNKFKSSVYSFILGLLIASPFAIIYLTVKDYSESINFSNPWIYIVGGVLVIVGTVFGLLMIRLERNAEKEPEVKEVTEENKEKEE